MKKSAVGAGAYLLGAIVWGDPPTQLAIPLCLLALVLLNYGYREGL